MTFIDVARSHLERDDSAHSLRNARKALAEIQRRGEIESALRAFVPGKQF
jgi:hypothetical protein